MKHTRFEYIGPNGREITLYGEFEQSVQDDGQTLKVFGSEAVAGWRPKFKSVEDFQNAWTNCMNYIEDSDTYGAKTHDELMDLCMGRFIAAMTVEAEQ